MTIRWLGVLTVVAGCSEMREGAKSSDPPVYWELAEDLRLDAHQEEFSQVGRFAAGSDGTIAIPLRQDGHVRVYDRDGNRVATIGRKGNGPGEFELIGNVGLTGDTIVVMDAQLRRVTWFGIDGRILRSMNYPQSSPQQDDDSAVVFFSALHAYADRSLLGQAYIGRFTNRGIEGKPALLKWKGEAFGPVLVWANLQDPRWFMEVDGFGRNIPFTVQPQVAIAPDGNRLALMTVDHRVEGGYTITMMRQAGDTIFHRTYPFDAISIPQSAIDSALAEFDRPVREGPSNLNERFKAIARDRMPSIYSPVQAIRIGLDNTVWIDRPTTDGKRFAMVLDERGDSIGAVLIPERSRIQQASLSHVWMTERDEFDLASVVRYRVVRR